MRPGEQQVASTLEEIRKDHVARYKLAAEIFSKKRIIDLGCGVGYGAHLLAEQGDCRVKAVDVDPEAVEYGKKHWKHRNVEHVSVPAETLGPFQDFGAAVVFEVIEHMQDPLPALQRLREYVPEILVSAPNELIFRYSPNIAYHHRHYTPEELETLLNRAGYEIEKWFGQKGPESECEENVQGRTIIALAKKAKIPKTGMWKKLPEPPKVPPQSVAIVAMGKSCSTYIRQCAAAGDRHVLAEETWAVNSMGSSLEHDLLFHMDDLRVQERRADAQPKSNVANMLRWMKTHPRFFTSRAYPDYPGSIDYPIDEVISSIGIAYFNSTVAYAVAYALHIGVKRIGMYGADYSYANLHKAERGRGCVEFWLGLAAARGVHVLVADETSLLDANEPLDRRIYGYDSYDLKLTQNKDGKLQLHRKIREKLPTAEEMEARYCYEPPPQPGEKSPVATGVPAANDQSSGATVA